MTDEKYIDRKPPSQTQPGYSAGYQAGKKSADDTLRKIANGLQEQVNTYRNSSEIWRQRAVQLGWTESSQ